MKEQVELVARAICTLNDGGYCECIGESLGCKVGRGEPPEVSRCKMTDAALPLTAEYRMAQAAIAALTTNADEDALSKTCAKIEADAVSGLRYIEQHYGRLEGVGWDRVFDAHDELFRLAAERDKALATRPAQPTDDVVARAKRMADAGPKAMKGGSVRHRP